MTHFNNAVSPEDLMSDLAEKLIRNKQQETATSPDDRIKIQSMEMIPEMQGHEGDVFYRALVRWIYLITDGEPKQRKQILKFCMKQMEELSGGRKCDPIETALIERIALTRLQLFHLENTFANKSWTDLQFLKHHEQLIESLDLRYSKALERLHHIRQKNKQTVDTVQSTSDLKSPRLKRLRA